MLKREITYTTFEDEPKQITEVFYFNISKRELAELDFSHGEQTFDEWFKNATAANDRKAMYDQFKEFIFQSYGERSEDGKRFYKSQELRDNFAHSAAFEALFEEFATNDGAMITFLKGILPIDMSADFDKAMATAALPEST